MEEVLKKIEKLLALAGNNPNEHEALAASLKAQELIAKYNVNIDRLGNHKDTAKIDMAIHNTGTGSKWRYKLAEIVARNFRCKVFLMNRVDIVFYGYETDAKAALTTFTFLFNVGNKLANRYYNNYRKVYCKTQGVRALYLNGFCAGIANALDAQCTALMVIIPQEVTDAYTEITMGTKTKNVKYNVAGNSAIYKDGQRDGKDAVERRKLGVANC